MQEVKTITDHRNANQLFPMRREGSEVKLKLRDVTISSAASHILDTAGLSGSQEYVVSVLFCAVNPLWAVMN